MPQKDYELVSLGGSPSPSGATPGKGPEKAHTLPPADVEVGHTAEIDAARRDGRRGRVFALVVWGVALVVVASLVVFFFSSSFLTDSPVCNSKLHKVPLAKMHSEIRKKVSNYFEETEGALFLAGGDVTYRYDTDVEQTFRQESNFLYFTGYALPNATVLMQLVTNRTFLFIPDRPVDYAVWNGKIEDPAAIMQEYGFDEVYYHSEFDAVLAALAKNQKNFQVFTLPYQHRFIPDEYSINTKKLQSAMYDSRTTKTWFEIQLLRTANNVSSDAHVQVMKTLAPGLYEYNTESDFVSTCLNCGLQHQAYLPIVASGNNSAVLHYNANDALMRSGQFLLIDAGAEYFGYAADITRTLPVNGKFSEAQSEVYSMVLEVQEQVMAVAAPGLPWRTLQDTATTWVCKLLLEFEYVHGTLEQCTQERIYALFMPHGVSHLIGLDVHDRYDPPQSALAAGYVLTVEPGIYFNDALLFPAFDDPKVSPFLNRGKIEPLLNAEFGGVRIEDDILITQSGYELLSTAPRTVAEIEQAMRA